MDPLSIAASAFSLAGGIAKASFAVIEFSRNARDASKDLSAVIDELHALSAVLDPIARCLTTTSATTIPEAVATQVDSALRGCVAVVEQITENVHKYRQDKIITKTKWVMFGQSDIQKLRESLEAYKMALGLGMHVVTMSINQAVKEDTADIRDFAAVIKLNTDEILARVNSIKRGDGSSSHRRIEDWIEDMTVLSTYAETTYQGTVADPTETWSHLDSPPRLSVDGNPSGDKLLTPLGGLERTLNALALEDAQRPTEVAKRKRVAPQVPTTSPPVSSAADHMRRLRIERASAPGLSERGQPRISDRERRRARRQTPTEPGKGEETPPQSPSTPFPMPNPSLPRHDPALFGEPSPKPSPVSDPPVVVGGVKGHKRSGSMGEIGSKLFSRSGELFGGRTRKRDAEQLEKRYPPMEMRNPTPSSESRISIDSRRSWRSFVIGRGKQRSGSVSRISIDSRRSWRSFGIRRGSKRSGSISRISIGSRRSRRSFAIGRGSKRSGSTSRSRTSQERLDWLSLLLASFSLKAAVGIGPDKKDDAHPLNLREPYRKRRASSFDGKIASASAETGPGSTEGRGITSSGAQRGILQKPKRFVDPYDLPESSGSGSSGPAKRVMDFFRRRGKARGESADYDFEHWV